MHLPQHLHQHLHLNLPLDLRVLSSSPGPRRCCNLSLIHMRLPSNPHLAAETGVSRCLRCCSQIGLVPLIPRVWFCSFAVHVHRLPTTITVFTYSFIAGCCHAPSSPASPCCCLFLYIWVLSSQRNRELFRVLTTLLGEY